MSARPTWRATRETWPGNGMPCVIVGAYTSRARFIRYAMRRGIPGAYRVECETRPGVWRPAGDAYVMA